MLLFGSNFMLSANPKEGLALTYIRILFQSDYSNQCNGHPTSIAAAAAAQTALPPPLPQPSTEAAEAAEAAERYRRSSLSVFRPESAPTVLDMSPENSLSGPPSSVGGRGGNVDLIDRSVEIKHFSTHLI